MIKTILTLAIIAIASFANAESQDWAEKKATISYSSMYGFYSCDYAESQTENYLAQLGAQNVQVRCSGGLPYDSFVYITAKFSAPVAASSGGGSYKAVRLESDESCDFNESIVRELIKHFTTKNVDSSSSCWHSQGRFRYDLDVWTN